MKARYLLCFHSRCPKAYRQVGEIAPINKKRNNSRMQYVTIAK